MPAGSVPASPSRAGMALLLLVLLQGTSTTLTFAVRLDPSGRLATLVTFIWLAGYALALALLMSRHGIEWIAWTLRYRLALALLLGGVAASIGWSLAPQLTLERAVHLTGSSLVALAIGFSLPLESILRVSTVVFGALLVASLVAAIAFPGFGLENYEGRLVWRGVMASKNTLGFWAAVATMLFGVRLVEAPRLAARVALAVLMLVSLTCLAKSVSATSVLALMVGVLVMLALQLALSLRLGGFASIVLGACVLGLSVLAIRYVNTAELLGRSGDLTGRGELWSQTWRLILSRPLGGYGYGTIWFPTEASLWIQESLLDFTWKAFHAHNGVLQLASEIGIPLTVLALAFCLQQILEVVHCHAHRRRGAELFVLGFSIALLVSNYSEARLLVNRELYWVWFVALPVSMLREVRLSPLTGSSASGSARASARSFARPPVRPGARPGARQIPPAVRVGLVRRRHRRRWRSGVKARLLARLSSPDTDQAPSGVE